MPPLLAVWGKGGIATASGGVGTAQTLVTGSGSPKRLVLFSAVRPLGARGLVLISAPTPQSPASSC